MSTVGVLVLLGRLLTGAILLLAGTIKLRVGKDRFLQAIMAYDILPKQAAQWFARAIPWLEVICGGLLVIGLFSSIASVVAYVLIFMFSAGITYSLARGREHDCGCMMSFNNQVQKVQWNLVYRNLILLGILVAVYAYRAGSLAFDQLIAGGIPNPWITYAMLSVWILFFVVVLGVHWYTRTRAKKNEAERAAAAAQRSGSTPAASPQ